LSTYWFQIRSGRGERALNSAECVQKEQKTERDLVSLHYMGRRRTSEGRAEVKERKSSPKRHRRPLYVMCQLIRNKRK